MNFEVINDKNKVVMHTKDISCIPDKEALSSMTKAGYRLKLNGKIASVKKLAEQLKEVSNAKVN